MDKFIEDNADEIVIELDDVDDDEQESAELEGPEDGEEVQEESEEVSAGKDDSDEQDQDDPDKEYTELSDEEKKKYGKRAQNRIRQLVRKTKELEEQLAQAEEERKKAAAAREEFDTKSVMQREMLLTHQEKALEAQGHEVLSRLKEAKESGDVEAEIKAQDALAAIKAEAIILQQVKRRFESEKAEAEGKAKAPAKETSPAEQPVIQPDRRAIAWNKNNEWFGGSSVKERVMTQTALLIHNDLLNDGFDPQNDPDSYYDELDSKIKEEFPEYFKAGDKKVKRTKQVVVGGGANRTPKGKKTVKLTQSEIDRAKRLGVTPEAYAREKLKLEASSK